MMCVVVTPLSLRDDDAFGRPTEAPTVRGSLRHIRLRRQCIRLAAPAPSYAASRLRVPVARMPLLYNEAVPRNHGPMTTRHGADRGIPMALVSHSPNREACAAEDRSSTSISIVNESAGNPAHAVPLSQKQARRGAAPRTENFSFTGTWRWPLGGTLFRP